MKKKKKKNQLSKLFIGMVTALLAVTIGVSSFHLRQRIAQFKMQENALKEEIKSEKQRAEEIDEFSEYVQTDEFIKNTARDKCGLADPNEIIFKSKDK